MSWGAAAWRCCSSTTKLGKTPEDHLLLQVQGMVAEYERAKILERSRRGKLHGARAGKIAILGRAPFGYRYVPASDGICPAQFNVHLPEAAVGRPNFPQAGGERPNLPAGWQNPGKKR